MVKKFLGLVYILLLPFALQADFANSDIYVSSSIDDYRAYANQPLNGTVTVTHDKNQAVDTSSFLLGNKPIKVEFVQDVKISSQSPLVISYYHFQIPAQPAGLYMLPEIAVKIDGKQYRSIMSSYEVQEAVNRSPASAPQPAAPAAPQTQSTAPASAAPVAAPAPTPAPAPSQITLKLEADAGTNKPLYPGQKTKFTYRYFYNGNVSLTKEQLPLLDAEGFLKFGDKESKEYTRDNMSVLEVSQMVQAIKPGTFSFGPSIIEGYAYTKNSKGQPSYSSSKLVSEVPMVAVTVQPFPEEGKPPFFNGAIGNFDFMTSLISSSEMHIGDEIKLKIDISGRGDIKEVALPDIRKQPGFDGFFRMSDLPPVGVLEGDTKHFVVSMRPIVEVKEIPEISFSFFNPATSKYATLTSKPIPIQVRPVEEKFTKTSEVLKKTDVPQVSKPSDKAVPVTYLPKPIEIQGNFNLKAADLYNKIFGTWYVLGIIPFALALLFYQITLRNYLNLMKSQKKKDTSEDLYREFKQQEKGSSRYFELLAKALKLKLVESGEINEPDMATESLASRGMSGEVRAFLSDIDQKRFSLSGELDPEALEAKAQSLMEKMDKPRAAP